MNDQEAIKYLVQVKGIGVWTAEMFLFFNQMRPDIFPVQDIGLLKEEYQIIIKLHTHHHHLN